MHTGEYTVTYLHPLRAIRCRCLATVQHLVILRWWNCSKITVTTDCLSLSIHPFMTAEFNKLSIKDTGIEMYQLISPVWLGSISTGPITPVLPHTRKRYWSPAMAGNCHEDTTAAFLWSQSMCWEDERRPSGGGDAGLTAGRWRVDTRHSHSICGNWGNMTDLHCASLTTDTLLQDICLILPLLTCQCFTN